MIKNIYKTCVISLMITPFLFSGPSHSGPLEKEFKASFIKNKMLKVAGWQLAHPKWGQTEWTNGAFYAGVYATWRCTDYKPLYNELIKMGEYNNWEPGPDVFNADDYAICQTYVDLFRVTKENKMLAPVIKNLSEFMSKTYPIEGDIKCIPWWWCDALFMQPPLMVKLGLTLNDYKYIRYADSLFLQTYNLLYDKEEHLFYRDLNYKSKEELIKAEHNGKKIFWSRGNGWVLGGLARILEELPENYPESDFYEKIFKEMSFKIASLQQADGLWRSSLLDPESYPGGEESGSAFYCYALAWGVNNGLLDRTNYLPVVEKAWKGLLNLVHRDGMIGWVQPVGADPRKDFSPDSWEVFGTGAFLLAGSEIIKLESGK
jgi:unsaturated rhamnogalacturonyl hydrolase